MRGRSAQVKKKKMTPIEFWKNWRLGTELRISGIFIYNGIYCYDQIEHFIYEEEIFEFLYNISVGLERLQKIALILLEDFEKTNLENFEKKLITHSHIDLQNRINKKVEINLGKSHNKFLNLLTNFYKSIRYERYSVSSAYSKNNDQKKFISFLESELDLKVSTGLIGYTENDRKIKMYIGKLIGKIINQLYDVITMECNKLNIHTNEMRLKSKAYKIFIKKQFDFENDKIIQKEMLLYLLKKKNSKSFKTYLENLPSLKLGEFDTNEYIDHILDFHKKDSSYEVENQYEEMNEVGKRLKAIKVLGDPRIYIDSLLEEE